MYIQCQIRTANLTSNAPACPRRVWALPLPAFQKPSPVQNRPSPFWSYYSRYNIALHLDQPHVYDETRALYNLHRSL